MEAGILIIISWYILNILWLIYGFAKVQLFIPQQKSPVTTFTVIIPFRNEADNLPKLLESFGRQNYPSDLFEVILVDDESSDNFQIPSRSFGTERFLVKNPGLIEMLYSIVVLFP